MGETADFGEGEALAGAENVRVVRGSLADTVDAIAAIAGEDKAAEDAPARSASSA